MAGCGRCASTYIKKVHPTFVGQSPSGEISFHNYFSNAIKIIVAVVVGGGVVCFLSNTVAISFVLFGNVFPESWIVLDPLWQLWMLFWSHFCHLGVTFGTLWLHFLCKKLIGVPKVPQEAPKRDTRK